MVPRTSQARRRVWPPDLKGLPHFVSTFTVCASHRLNLALKDTLSSIQLLRNVLGTVQELYNFLEGSPKRSEIFKSTEIDMDEDVPVTTLKNQGAIRWGAKQNSVVAVSRELKRCVKVLALLMKEVCSKARATLKNIYSEEFIFGVTLLDTILTPTNKLSDFSGQKCRRRPKISNCLSRKMIILKFILTLKKPKFRGN